MRSTRGALRLVACISACVAACVGAANPASAAVVSAAGTTISIAAAPGEANTVVVVRGPEGFGVSDSGLLAGPGCIAGPPPAPGKPSTVICLGSALSTIAVDLGDGDDTFNASDLPAALTVAGGPGNDRIYTFNLIGSFTATGDDGRDYLAVGSPQDTGSGPVSLDGGGGDDYIVIEPSGSGPVRVATGAGQDKVIMRGVPGVSLDCGPDSDHVLNVAQDTVDAEKLVPLPRGAVGCEGLPAQRVRSVLASSLARARAKGLVMKYTCSRACQVVAVVEIGTLTGNGDAQALRGFAGHLRKAGTGTLRIRPTATEWRKILTHRGQSLVFATYFREGPYALGLHVSAWRISREARARVHIVPRGALGLAARYPTLYLETEPYLLGVNTPQGLLTPGLFQSAGSTFNGDMVTTTPGQFAAGSHAIPIVGS